MSKLGINIEDLFNLSSAVIYNPDEYKVSHHVTINSRNVKKNSIFVAIKGERLDGHKFVKDAVKNGAGTIVISHKRLKNFEDLDVTIVTVKDTTVAYGELSSFWRSKYKGKVIGITGSSGKTSTKEMIATLLAEKYPVNKSIANNNNHIGVPLTILDTIDRDGAMVLEHGTNHFGEIEYTAKYSRPDISLITNIGSSHLEYLVDKEGVLKEKQALLKYTRDNGGLVLINNDDSHLKKLKKIYKKHKTYGFKGNPDIKGKIIGFNELGCPEVKISYKNKTITATLPLLGIANAKNYLAACAVALMVGLAKKEILSGTRKLKPAKGRLEFVENKDFMLIDDAYNSNPDSVKAAIEVLKKIKKYGEKVLVLGDMLELGKDRIKLHEELADNFKGIKNLDIITYGPLMKKLYAKLDKEKLRVRHFNRRDLLVKSLSKMNVDDSVVLIKGSRGMQMDEFVKVMKERG